MTLEIILTASLWKSADILCIRNNCNFGRYAASALSRTLDQPGVATLKLKIGVDVIARGGTIHSTSSSTFGECHARVTRCTGRPGTKAGANLLEPIYDVNAGNALGESVKEGMTRGSGPMGSASPPRHKDVIVGCRDRNSERGTGLGERSAMEEKVFKRGKMQPLSAGR